VQLAEVRKHRRAIRVIARAGRPIARLVALSDAPSQRRSPGAWRGKVSIADDFDELPAEMEAAFRGERP
jgi:antitoxin (DNA-binding transcriptional repressor) of toxin-antitoxin stability system